MKKVLYISDYLAIKNVGAYQVTISHLKTIKEIVGQENVDVISLTGNRECDDLEYICIRGYKNKREKIKNFLQFNNPYINNSSINRINELINKSKYDVVFIDNSIYGKLVKEIKKSNKKIKVISFYMDVKRNLCKEWLKKYGIKYLPDFFVNVYNEYLNAKYCDFNIVLNEREKKVFEKFYKKLPSIELPIYLEDKFSPQKIVNEKNDILKVLFIGAYYYPNVNGITWFIKNVLKKISNVEIYIVGNGMERLKDILAYENVNVVGAVEDLSEYYYMSDVVIAPIFEGAGMKVKTAEAFMYGKAFIGTSESLEGYKDNINTEVFNKKIHLCDTEDKFIEAFNYIYINRKKINKFNHDVREIYEKKYSTNMAYEKLSILI